MITDPTIALRDYITKTLAVQPEPSPDPPYDDGNYYWEGGKISSNRPMSDDTLLDQIGLQMSFGWAVSLDTADHVVHIDFADTEPDDMQERLKTIIGHCVVSGVACMNSWTNILPVEEA